MKTAPMIAALVLATWPPEILSSSSSSIKSHGIKDTKVVTVDESNCTSVFEEHTRSTKTKTAWEPIAKVPENPLDEFFIAESLSSSPSSSETGQKSVSDDKQKEKRNFIGGQEAATLRRIKSEWKDAVKLGIAYDWKKMENVSKKENDEKYSYVRIGPYGNNLLNWHFSVMGPPKSEYEGGIYHGRVLLPKDYPGSPPRVQVLTPCGRFVPGHDICLSASNYHPESWTPKWTVLSLIDALRLHMITQANEIGGMTATPYERRKLARESRAWSTGRISHRVMTSQGVFRWENPFDDGSDPAMQTTADLAKEIKHAQRLSSMRTRDSQHAAKRVPKQFTLIVIEILNSPQRLALVALIALFVILNLK